MWSSADASKGLAVVVAAALLPLISFAVQFSPLRFFAVLGAAGMTGFAAFAVGGLLGFLFGFPKLAAASRRTTSETVGSPEDNDEGYGPNTNLEQISNWLTAALVGAGLTQLGALGKAASSLGQFLTPTFGDIPSSGAVAIGTVVYFIAFGFLFGYLMARIRLPSAFERADRRARLEREQLTDTIRSLPAPSEDEPESSIELDESDVRRLEAAQKKAEQLSERGVRLAAKDYRRLARQLKATRRFNEAVEAYKSAFEADPSDPAPLMFAGVITGRDLNRPDEAEEFYRRALAVDPGYTAAIYNMACNEARRGRYEQALALLTVATTSPNGERYKALAQRDAQESSGPFFSLGQDQRFRNIVG